MREDRAPIRERTGGFQRDPAPPPQGQGPPQTRDRGFDLLMISLLQDPPNQDRPYSVDGVSVACGRNGPWRTAKGRFLPAGGQREASSRSSPNNCSGTRPSAETRITRWLTTEVANYGPRLGVAATICSRSCFRVLPEESFHSIRPFAVRPSKIAAAAEGDLNT